MLGRHGSGATAVESCAYPIDPIENGSDDRDQRSCHTPAHQGMTVGRAWTGSLRRRAKFEKAAAIVKRCRQPTAFVVGEPRAPSSKQACLIQMRSCHVIVATHQHSDPSVERLLTETKCTTCSIRYVQISVRICKKILLVTIAYYNKSKNNRGNGSHPCS